MKKRNPRWKGEVSTLLQALTFTSLSSPPVYSSQSIYFRVEKGSTLGAAKRLVTRTPAHKTLEGQDPSACRSSLVSKFIY